MHTFLLLLDHTLFRCYTFILARHWWFPFVGRNLLWARLKRCCYAVTHCLFINLAGNLYNSFHTVIFISAVTLLRCYPVTNCLPETWLSICISCCTRSFSHPMLCCYTLPTCNLLSICISRFTRSFLYPMLRCYHITLLQIAYLKPGSQSV